MKGKISRESDIQVLVHGLVDGVLIRISSCEGNFLNLKQLNKDVDESWRILGETHLTLLRKSPGPFPFIIGIGNKFNVIVDGSALTFLEDKLEDASLCLIATYYVLGVQWCPDSEPTYLFIKKTCWKSPTTKPTKRKKWPSSATWWSVLSSQNNQCQMLCIIFFCVSDRCAPQSPDAHMEVNCFFSAMCTI